MSGYDPYTQSWGNPPSNGVASFDQNVASSQSRSRQQHGAPVPTIPYYPELDQIAAASEAPQRHAAGYPAPVQAAARSAVTAGAPQFTGGASGSTPRDTRRGHKLAQSGPQAAAISPQLNVSGLPQDYHQHQHLSAGWTPAAAPAHVPVIAGQRPSHADPHAGRQPGVDYSIPSSSQPPLARQRRSSSQHYGPSSPQLQQAGETSAAGGGTEQRCIIPLCQYKAYYNVTEQEQMEYCGHGHELQAIESGFAKPCTMCKRRPRRSGERVCGRVCKEQERQALQVQGSYYGVQVTRREPQTRSR